MPRRKLPFDRVLTTLAGAVAIALAINPTAVAQADWTLPQPASSPPPWGRHTMASDRAQGVLVMFGGAVKVQGVNVPVGDTWSWDGTNWAQVATATAPPARYRHAMVEVTRHGRIVLFGGDDGQNLLGDTWAWDGTTWSLLTTTGSPGPRRDHAMAYDAARDRIVLHGGFNGYRLADTWTFDWTTRTWTEVAIGSSPLNRSNHKLAYDEVHEQIVMFGGFIGSVIDETWLWDGAAWTLVTPTRRPPARAWASMAWDPVRARVVLFGGGNLGTRFGDTWEWDGIDWTQRTPTSAPLPSITNKEMAYDPSTDGLLLYLRDPATGMHETWRYATNAVATVTTYGSGCPTSAGVAQLTVSGPPWVGDMLDYEIAPLPAASLPFVLLGASNTTWNGLTLPFSFAAVGYPSCLLLQSADVASAGSHLALTIPTSAALIGRSYYTQGMVLVPDGAPALGVTSGLEGTIGAR